MDKNSFILYTDQKEVINKLSDEQAGKILKALYEYVSTNKMPELDLTLDIAITPIKQSLDRNKEKYEEVSKKRKQAGAKGGKQTQAKQANAKNDNQIEIKQASSSDSDNDSDSVSDSDNEYVNDNDSDITEEEKEEQNCPYQKIEDLYHDICKSYPKIRGLSKTRKQALKARYIEYRKDINIFKELFQKAEESNFLKGQNNNNWSATFDWLINSRNMTKVLEGNYKNKEEINGDTKVKYIPNGGLKDRSSVFMGK